MKKYPYIWGVKNRIETDTTMKNNQTITTLALRFKGLAVRGCSSSASIGKVCFFFNVLIYRCLRSTVSDYVRAFGSPPEIVFRQRRLQLG